MKRALVCLLPLLLTACDTAGATDVYYIDFDQGRDTASGKSPAAPWQHAPGDPAATGTAAATKLAPGDTVRFRGGVLYRGSITLATSGSAGKPITFSGTGYGSGPAVIEGADPVSSTIACPSAAACGDTANWQQLSLVRFTPPSTALVKFYDKSGLLYEAQKPTVADKFFSDDISTFAESSIAEKSNIEAGRLKAPEMARLMQGVPRGTLQIWVAGNQVVRREVTGIDGDKLLFDPAGIKLYPDRPGRFALINFAGAIAEPGQYVVLGPGQAVVWTRPGAALMVGNGRGGFNMRNRDHIVIDGFTFRHQTSAVKGRAEGGAIVRQGAPGDSLKITNNRFLDSALWDGKGVITIDGISDAVITNNKIARIERGSGMRVGENTVRLKVSGNEIDSVGRTGIMFLGAADSEITNNIITNLRGRHGNGISLYLANRRIRVADNIIQSTTRPLTFNGDKSRSAPGDHDFLIERNIFIATDDAQAALTGWGGFNRNVTIRNNVLIAPKGGLLTNGGDTGLTITDNYISGILFNKGRGSDWTVANNGTAPNNLRFDPQDAGAHAKMCRAANIAAGQSLGGLPC